MESIKITYLENKHTYPLICITVRLLVEIHGQCMQMVSCCFFTFITILGLSLKVQEVGKVCSKVSATPTLKQQWLRSCSQTWSRKEDINLDVC